MTPTKNLYSVVIPVYNSSKIIDSTVSRIRNFFLSNELSFEIILVNDGSKDNSWGVIAELANKYPELTSINLLKNYGQHCANLCGFNTAKGDFIITMDDDLQNPPEELEKLINKISEGYDLVIGRFELKKHAFTRRIGSKFVGWLNRKVFGIKSNLILTNFRIIHRDVIDRICQEHFFDPYIPGLILKFSSNQCNILVRHSARADGKSNYTMRKLLKLIGNILFNHSSLPLRYAAVFGFLVSSVSFLLSFYYLMEAIIVGTSVPGWTSLAVLLSFLNGVLILLLSIIGEYIIRVLRQISPQRSYEIKEIIS